MRNRKTAVARHIPILSKALLLICALSFAVTAQTSATDGSTPLGLQPGAPAGSYALSGFDNVNLYNGHLNFQLSLLGVIGRGGAQMPVMLPIEGKWRVLDLALPQPDGSFNHFYLPTQSWWENNDRKYRPGSVVGRQGSFDVVTCPDNTTVSALTLTRFTFTAPDGTEFELRDQLTGGQPANNTNCNYLNPPSRGTVFVSSDGSAATFVSDTTIYDYVISPNPAPEIYPSGYLMLREGTRFRIEGGRVTWVRDRNGNKLTFGYDSNNNVQTITDSLNRVVTIIRNTGPGTFDQITYKGFSGAQRIVKVNYSSLASALRSDYPNTVTYKALFPALDGSSTTHHNPSVVSSVTLPNNQQYQIRYNPYGEVARVVLPTGGALEYDYAAAWGDAGGAEALGFEGSFVVYRRVIERRVYPDGGSGGAYANRATYEVVGCVVNATCVQADQRNSAGTVLTRSKHYFHGISGGSFSIGPIEYSGWKEGREYQTEEFAGNGTTILRRTENTWQQRLASGWWGSGSDTSPANDPRLSETKTTLVDTNQVAKQTFSYDDTVPFNNRSDVYEYDFGTGSVGALKRRTHTDYLKTNPVNSTDYTTTSIHLRGLPTQTQVFDAAGVERARTTFEYDNYANDGSHAPLQSRSNISGHDAGFTTSFFTRGNLTRTTGWILSSSTQLQSHHQYDIAGNVVKSIDARGNPTTFEFADRYGTPDTEAQGNTAPSELGGQTSYAFASKVTNALGHISYAQFDYYLGRPVNGEDPNGIIASGSYIDSLDRPTQVKRAIGTGAENQTTFAYDDTLRIITTSSDRDANNDNLLVSKLLYDQMGRTIEARQYEGGTNYIATQIQYDALGRAFKSSNPFRPWQSQTAVWTTQAFDALGRVISVTTPDNAVVSTTYNGNSVTVTDQAGKARESVIDALGRLVEIYEDPAGQDYQTSYNYDVLDNLVKVTQGTQQRFFMYDSLKRLIRARNPEQGTNAGLNLSDPLTGNSAWSSGYQYDASSNLTQKTDARGVVSVYAYDALNRNTTVDYSNTASINPDVKRFYDGATNGKGRFWHFYCGGDHSTGSNVDHTSVDSYDAMGRPLVQRQLFKLNGVWSPTYEMSRGYNRAGAVISQTYPSGRSVSYGYDNAGRLETFSGTLGDGLNRSYSTEILYSPFGGIAKEKFGTGTPLFNKSFYNNRGQLSEIRVGTTYTGPTDTGWQRGALINHYSSQCWGACSGTDNNGNLKQQDHWIPDGSGGVQAVFVQTYTYDSLNRLQRVQEGSWQQEFVYDRWGNRTIHQGNSWGTGINKKQFDVDSNTNRLLVPGGQTGVMNYDAAGNLTNDTYSSYGSRTYDAENKMTSAQDSYAGWSYYTYNADGQRTRRKINNQVTWQVYGFDGELLAEYGANAAASTPQKEYGYRNGQLLINATPGLGLVGHWKADENTGTTTLDASGNVNTGTLTSGAGWASGQSGSAVSFDGVNDYVQVGAQSRLVLTSAASFSAWVYPTGPGSDATHGGTILVKEGEYVIARYPNGTIRWGFANSNPGWTFVDTGYVAPLNQWTHLAITYDNGTIKTYANGSLVHTYSGSGAIGDAITGQNDFRIGGRQVISQHFQGRIDEVRIYDRVLTATEVSTLANGPASAVLAVNWLVADHLGTARLILDQTGTLANIQRHDYLPFGEEIGAGVGGRTTQQGYSQVANMRQKFAGTERDDETELDFVQARYHSSWQGRFTSLDPLDGVRRRPQSWNKFAYCLNNPLTYVDPTGERWAMYKDGGTTYIYWFDDKAEEGEQSEYDYALAHGWQAVDFDESKPHVHTSEESLGGGLTRTVTTTFNPDGTGNQTARVWSLSIESQAFVFDHLTGTGIGGAFASFFSTVHTGFDNFERFVAELVYERVDVFVPGGQYRKPKPGLSGKEGAKDIPSWAKGEKPLRGENGDQFARRLLDNKYGKGNYSTKSQSEYSKLKKFADRNFEP